MQQIQGDSDKKSRVGKTINSLVKCFQDQDRLILNSDIKFVNMDKNDILDAVKGLNEENLKAYAINLSEIKIEDKKIPDKTEKNKFTDEDLEKYTNISNNQRKINKLKWLLFCHLGVAKEDFQNLYDSMLVDENVSEENQFKILKRFPYLRLYLDLSENEKKMFSNGYVPKVFFEKDFLTKMMKYHWQEDGMLNIEMSKTTKYKQKFRTMFMDICQNRIDRMEKQNVCNKLEFLSKSANFIYHTGNSLPHFLTKNDRSFNTIKSFFNKNGNTLFYFESDLLDNLMQLKKSNLLRMNILDWKQKVLVFMYYFFCIDIFQQNKNTKQKLFYSISGEKIVRCSLLASFLFALIFVICEFSIFCVIMAIISIGTNLYLTNLIVERNTIFKKIDEYIEACSRFNEMAQSVTINGMSYYKYKEYRLYTERCLKYVNEASSTLRQAWQKYERKLEKLEKERIRKEENKKAQMKRLYDAIKEYKTKMESQKEKEINTNNNQIANLVTDGVIKIDKPMDEQMGKPDDDAAPAALYSDYELDLPTLEEILKAQENKQKNNTSDKSGEAPAYLYNINEIELNINNEQKNDTSEKSGKEVPASFCDINEIEPNINQGNNK